MKNGAFILLVLLIAGFSLNTYSKELLQRSSVDDRLKCKPFSQGFEYTFDYNAQLSSGLMVGQETVDSHQTAATRVQCKARITFQTRNDATLRLEEIRIGYLNEELDKPEEVQPMGKFELKNIHVDKRTKLELPVQFKYVDGVVESIQFQADDETWSQNIKRSVLNMIQLNLKKNNVQRLRNVQLEKSSEEEQEESQQLRYKAFTIPEVTIEGDCQTTYTMNEAKNPNGLEGSESSESTYFNVTKSINFKQCSKVADVGYGFQTQQVQPKWAQCQQQWKQMQQGDRSQRQQLSPTCEKYDPKEIKEQKLDRSTVMRFQLCGKPQLYAIQRVELISHYVFKNLQAENSKYGSAMHTFVAAELVFMNCKESQRQNTVRTSGKQETLLYSNAWDVEEKRFYMFGDQVFGRNSPFQLAANKAEQAQQILRKLIQTTSDKANGIEAEITIQVQRLVELLRMCSVEELKKIYSQLRDSVSSQNEVQQHRAEHLIADCLAIAGTRNTISFLVDKLLSKELSSTKGVQALKNLNQLPAPSYQLTDLVLRLCENELSKRSPALKQSCWLTFGSMVAELCHQNSINKQHQSFGFQTGFEINEEICPTHKKELYKKALTKEYEEAENTSEKMLALRAIGNAGMDCMVSSMEKIINKLNEEPMIRITAIDSLRRLRNKMPRKIQRVLLPIYQNQRELPEIRMAAFTMIMHTIPEQNVIDQITFTLMKESSEQVKSFVYSTMQSLSRSKITCHQELSHHLKNSLKLANIEPQNLSGSRKHQLPILCNEQNEGVLMDLVSVFSGRDMLPAHLSASIHTILNDEFEFNTLRVSVSQQELSRWYEQLIQQINNVRSETMFPKTRANHKSSSRRGDEEIQQIQRSLGIKMRNTNDQESRQDEEFAVLNVRIGDIDQVILPISKETVPQLLKEIINQRKPSLNNFVPSSEPQHMRFVIAMNLNKKSAMIPTSMGVALKIAQAAPVLATFEGEINSNMESAKMDNTRGFRAHVSLNPTVCITHIQKMESWMPFVNTGVESYRALEGNLPIQMELTANNEEGIKLKIKTPQAPKTTVFGIHTLPTTFSRDYDNKNNMHREPRVKAIHHYHLEELQCDVDQKLENTMDMPFRIHGHYHKPSDVTDYKQWIQLAMGTENHIHVTFEPNKNTPREMVIQLNVNTFQKIQSYSHVSKLQEFYANAGNFESAYPEDIEDMELESQKERSENLKSYIAKYQHNAGQLYKHEMKVEAHTVGGRRQFKAEMKLEGICDAKLKYCKVSSEIERSPMYENERNQWTLISNMQIVTPELSNTVQELKQQSEKNKKFFCMIDTNWGSGIQQNIKLRIQGESAQKPQWKQQMEVLSDSQQQSEQKRMSFLNKYDVVAEYKIEPTTQNMFNSLMELAKGYNFWNTKSEQNSNGRNGQFVAMVVIDPLTQCHANITLKTPNQKVRMQSVLLPIQMRPFPLVSRQPEPSTHSISQALSRLSTQGRAECKVDGKRVETFDEVLYKAPISTCYSVLAKDCSSETSKFVVLMKKLYKNQEDKKIKILTPENIIECQPMVTGGVKKLECQVNDETVIKTLDSNRIVDYTNEEQDELTVNVEGVSVQFGCEYNNCESQKVIIRISNLFKNHQCGLCGHYDDDSEDEWRMNNDETSEDLMQFHRSYSLQDNMECNTNEHNEIYAEQNKKDFSVESREIDEMTGKVEDYNESSSEEEEKWNNKQYRNRNVNNNPKNQEPQMQTKIIEYNHKICFSKMPVKQCSEGMVPDENTRNMNKVNVAFVCLNRSSIQARQLQRQVRRGETVEISQSPSFVDPIEIPTRCTLVY